MIIKNFHYSLNSKTGDRWANFDYLRIKHSVLKFKSLSVWLIITGIILCTRITPVVAQNPVIHDQFTADPSARIFNNKVYVFPSHDIKAPEGKNLGKPYS